MSLTFFTKLKYSNVSLALSDIRNEFRAIWNVIDNTEIEESTGAAVTSEELSTTPQVSGSASYNGYFTIKLTTNDSGMHVTVCDGANPEGYQQCTVNGKVRQVSSWSKTYPSNATSEKANGWVIFIKYDALTNSLSIGDTYDLSSPDDLPDSTNDAAYYLVGRIDKKGVHQDHMAGAAQILWFYRCE